MLMIGVMPLPALTKSSLLGQRVGQAERPLDLAQVDHRVLADLAAEERRELPLLDALDRDRDEVPRVVRVGGDRVRAPVADAVDLGADPQVLAGQVAGPRGARLDHDGGRVGASRAWSSRPARAARASTTAGSAARCSRRAASGVVRPRAARRKPRRSGETFGSAPFSTNSRSRSLVRFPHPTHGRKRESIRPRRQPPNTMPRCRREPKPQRTRCSPSCASTRW